MTTGMRRGELAGLRWTDVDLDASRLRVTNTHVVVNYAVVTGTSKSKSSERTIAIDAVTVAALRAHCRRQLEERLAFGPDWPDTDVVFVRDEGAVYCPGNHTRMLAAAARTAGLPVITTHTMRHSYATAGLEVGMARKVMSDRLGHSWISITADLYSHVRPEVDQDAADRTAAYIQDAADRTAAYIFGE
jgi:integrase